MIECPSCGKVFHNDVKFCDACGAKIGMQQSYDSYNDENTVFQSLHELPSTASAYKQTKTKNFKPAIIGLSCSIAALIIVYIGLLAFIITDDSGNNYALYYKDDEIQYTDLPKIETFEVSDNEGAKPAISSNGKYIVFIDDSDDDCTLKIRSTNKEKNKTTKIKDDVKSFTISNNSKYIVYVSDNNLYEYNISTEESTKIKNDIYTYSLSENGEKVYYIIKDSNSEESDVYDYYIKTLGNDNNKKIASEANSLYFCNSETCQSFYYISFNKLYFARSAGHATKIDSDVESIDAVFEDNSVYYLKSNGKSSNTKYTLTYYNGKNEPVEIISDYYTIEIYSQAKTKPYAIYSIAEKEDEENEFVVLSFDKTSKITHSDAVDFSISEDGKSLYYLADLKYAMPDQAQAYGDNSSAATEGGYDYTADSEATTETEVAVEITGELKSGTLYHAVINKNGIKETTKYDTGVYNRFYVIDEKNVAYIKNFDLEEGYGNLFINKKKIDTEVNNFLYAFKDSKKFVYIKDLKDETYTLYLSKNAKKTEKISDDVSMAEFTGKGDIIYIKDYDSDDKCGYLYFYKNNKNEQIDSEVTSFVGDYSVNLYIHD